MDIRTGSQGRSQTVPRSRSAALASIWAKTFFHGLGVSVPDLHRPDMLNTVYLGLFKHVVDWVQGSLKKHERLQAFDHVWKALPPYRGFLVPKKAYLEVAQWQGKAMRNLGGCIL